MDNALVPSKLVEGSVAVSSALVGKQGEWVEPVSTHAEGAGEGQHEAGKAVTVVCMQKMECRLDDVCTLLEALVTGCHMGEGAGPVEYTPSPGGALSRFEYQEQPLYGMPGTAVYRLPPFAGEEGCAPGNLRIEAVRKQSLTHGCKKGEV
ncbi:hypothetical protein GGI05_000531 [Coemansia sp. RSA 2603]|nr:hypothetical protein GGI05_000531 [Coemansia sp. RSA 2603]